MDEATSSSRTSLPPSGGQEAWDDERIEAIGRYTLHARIGKGGMASVHLGWLSGAADFSRVVAIKRLHPQFALDPQFAARFRDEARLCSRVAHPNVVEVLDVVEKSQELLIVMEYVHGLSVASILADARAAGRKLPPAVVAGILVPALFGLHAAHEATDDDGHPIEIVHRDFSPQNIMVSAAGHAKVLDFGIAKARTHVHVTTTGQVSGKCGYFAPEQVLAGPMDRRTDVFAAGIVLWELLTGRRLFFTPDTSEVASIQQVLHRPIQPPSTVNPLVPDQVDQIALQALERDPGRRFESARELALRLEAATGTAGPAAVADWVERVSGERLAALGRRLEQTRRRMRQAQVAPAIPAPASEDAPAKLAGATVVLPNRTPARRAFVSIGLALAAAVLSLSLWARWVASSSTGSAAASAMSRPSGPSITSVSPVSYPLDEAVPVATPAHPPEHGTNAPAEPAQGGKARAGIRAAKARHPARLARKADKRPSSPSCDPPTYLDPDGVRIYKDECL